MKKLYHRGTVHPSPQPSCPPPPSPPPLAFTDYLQLLPAAILSLAVALSAEDTEVLAYLISCSSFSTTTTKNAHYQRKESSIGGGSGVDHSPAFNCSCFRCYMSYWVRWDSSPNRLLIHEIIDKFEDGLVSGRGKNIDNNNNRGKRGRKKKALLKNGSESSSLPDACIPEMGGSGQKEIGFIDEEVRREEGAKNESGESDGKSEEEKGSSVRKLVSFIGERIWGVWG